MGCGDGLFFDRLAEFGEVEGVEADPAIVNARGPHAGRIHIQPFDARFRPGKHYGVILMLDVLEHLDDPQGALRHAVDLLADDGALVVTVPAFRSLWTSHDDLNHHYTRYTKRSFRPLAAEAGLAIDQARYFFHWTCAAKLAVRVKERLWQREPRPEAVPAAVVNRALYALSMFEQQTIGRLPLPIGTSLLVVGRKGNLAPDAAQRFERSCELVGQ